LLIDSANLLRLLGRGSADGLKTLPYLLIEAALDRLDAALIERTAAMQDAEPISVDQGSRLPLICFLGTAGQPGRLGADLHLGEKLAVGAVVLEDWTCGTTLAVEPGGLIADATGRAAVGLVGVCLPMLDEAEARAKALPVTAKAASSGPCVQAAPVQTAPGTVKLLEQYSIEGPSEWSSCRSVEMWPLLGLFAEQRTASLTRAIAEDRLWPDMEEGSDRFRPLLKETRAKLCDALGRPHNQGKYVIQNLGASGYRVNPDLFTFDIWQLRDLLAAARRTTGEEQASNLATAVDLYTGPYLPDSPHGWAKRRPYGEPRRGPGSRPTGRSGARAGARGRASGEGQEHRQGRTASLPKAHGDLRAARSDRPSPPLL
jgi:hypothetical protein